MSYNPALWYWLVGNKPDQVFSSAAPGYLAPTDPAYEAWLAAGNLPTQIATDGELASVLKILPAPVVAAAGWSDWGACSVDDQALTLRAAGCRIQSTATPALDALYAIDDSTIAKLTAIAGGINAGKGLPGGGATFNLLDAAGVGHPIGSADFLSLAAALESYVYDLIQTEMSLLGGHGGTWPTQPVTIA